MAVSMLSKANPLTTRYTDVRDEPVTRFLTPINGYQKVPLVSLEKSLEPVSHLFDEIQENAWVAKANCQHPKEDLTQDESAAIHLYTMQFDGGPSLFDVLNQILRAENRQNLQPWYLFLKLFLTGLYKLPSRAQTVWRGVRDVDLSSNYPKGQKIVWWGVSSCTVNVEVLKNQQFLSDTGIRTIFSIECQNGKAIALHSYFKNIEEEVILLPGSYFEVIGQLNPAAGLHIIQLKEINAPFPFVKPPFSKSAAIMPTVDTTPLNDIKPPTASSILSPPVYVPSKQVKSLRISSATKTKPLAPNSYVSKVEVEAVPQATANSPAANKLNVPYTSPTGKFEVITCDMSLYLQERAVSFIIPAIDEGGAYREIASRIKKAMDKENKSTWNCVVGNQFGNYVSHSTGGFLLIKYGKQDILLWKFDE